MWQPKLSHIAKCPWRGYRLDIFTENHYLAHKCICDYLVPNTEIKNIVPVVTEFKVKLHEETITRESSKCILLVR